MKILLIRPEMIGDTVMLTPLVSEIKSKYPHAQVKLMLRPHAFEVVKNNPDIAGVIFSDGKNFWQLLLEVKKDQFDWSIVLEDNPAPAFALLCLLAGIPNRVGDKARLLYGWTYNRGVWLNSADKSMHQVELHGQLLKPLGIERIDAPYKIITGAAEDIRFGELAKGEKLIGLHIGTGGGDKSLLPETYAEIANRLGKVFRLALIGGEKEKPALSEIKKKLQVPIIDFVGTLSLFELCSLIKRLALFIGVNSGPLHIASAFRIPVIAIYVAKDILPDRWFPWKTKYAIIKNEAKCPLKCSHRECVFDYCAKGVAAEKITGEAASLLHQTRLPEK